VLEAYEEALGLEPGSLALAREILQNYGGMGPAPRSSSSSNGFWRDTRRGVREHLGPGTGLLRRESSEVRADAVVREAEGPGQILNGATGSAASWLNGWAWGCPTGHT
jgi:hypothetical protein